MIENWEPLELERHSRSAGIEQCRGGVLQHGGRILESEALADDRIGDWNAGAQRGDQSVDRFECSEVLRIKTRIGKDAAH